MAGLLETYFIRHFASCVWNEGLAVPGVGTLRCQNKHKFTLMWGSLTAICAALPGLLLASITRNKLASALGLLPVAPVMHFWAKHSYSAFGFGWVPFAVRVLAKKPPAPEQFVRFVVVSDTHKRHSDVLLPDGDVLLHCGDFTEDGTLEELSEFNEWLGTKCSKYRRRIVIAGNHDLVLDPEVDDLVWEQFIGTSSDKKSQAAAARAVLTNCEYLEAEEAEPERGIRIYGAPWTPLIAPPGIFAPWGFNRDAADAREALRKQPRPFVNVKKVHEPLAPVSLSQAVPSAEECWSRVPEGIDILMTHGPPKGRCDNCWGRSLGDATLLAAVERISPRFHVFGHLHEAYGVCTVGNTTFVNASSCTFLDDAVHRPVVFDVPVKR